MSATQRSGVAEDSLRLLGLDVGDRRIGVAISDPTGSIASPVEVYHRRGPAEDVQHVIELVEKYEATGIVMGLPKNMNGTEGPQAEKTRQFGDALGQQGLSVSFWDERLSTVEAARRMSEQGHGRRRHPLPGGRRAGNRPRIDSEAAALILQTYLDHVRLTRMR